MSTIVSLFIIFAMTVFSTVCIFALFILMENWRYKQYYRSLRDEIQEALFGVVGIYTDSIPTRHVEVILKCLHRREWINWQKEKYSKPEDRFGGQP